MTSPKLAKLAPPRLANVYPRERLFGLLDHVREEYNVVWISAPGGAGKTSLAASWIATRKLPLLWYQVDSGDSDIASFFYYLGIVVQHTVPRHKKSLPLLTPEYLRDIPTFARNFFRELFQRVKQHAVLVLDNYQDAPQDSPLHDVLNIAMSEVPEGITLLVLSRDEPPAALARLRLCNHAACLDWPKLQLTREESIGIAALRLGYSVNAAILDGLHECAHGWAAGLVLMLEQGRGETFAVSPETSDRKLIFDYFAGELFARSTPAEQEFLLKTSLFPKFTVAWAVTLTDNVQAQAVLDDLTRRNYFTVIHANDPPIYEFHPLFREFLRHQATLHFGAIELNTLRTRTAQLLAAEGDIEAAARLFIQEALWEPLMALILDYAEKLILQGRHATLREWFAALPAPQLDTNPWLRFWLGVATQTSDLFKAREYFTQAYRAFRAEGNTHGIYAAWSAVVDTFMYHWADFTPLTYWIEEMYLVRKEHTIFPSIILEARVVGGMVSALLWRDLRYEIMKPWVERAEDLLLKSDVDSTQRLIIANSLMIYYVWFRGDLTLAARLLSVIRPLLRVVNTEPLPMLVWAVMEGTYLAVTNQTDNCLHVVENGLKLADESGVHFHDTLLNAQGVYGTLSAADFKRAQHYLERSRKSMLPDTFFDIAHFYYQATWVAICRDDFNAAREYLDLSGDFAVRSGAVNAPIWLKLTRAYLQTTMGDFANALVNLDESKQWAITTHNHLVSFHCLLTKAYILLKTKQVDAMLIELRNALQLGKRQGYIAHPWIGWHRDVMAQLYAVALQYNIQSKYVSHIVKKRALAPPTNIPVPKTWPFPLKLHTLGRFELMIDDEPVVSKGKAQKKPTELLKALIAFGGREVSVETLSEALWPEAEGDTAYQNFTITLLRLRKLIRYKNALVLTEGKLTLDSHYASVDVWDFERGLNQEDPVELYKILKLYQGSFLEKDLELPWVFLPRERLRNKYTISLLRLGQLWEHQQNTLKAIALYQQGLAIDPLVEKFYQGLLRCYSHQGECSEVIKTYEQCQRLLAEHLGISPGIETERLYRQGWG